MRTEIADKIVEMDLSFIILLDDLDRLETAQAIIAWLRRHIEARKLIINDAKALVHTVADTIY